MDGILFPTVIAMVAALLCWGVTSVFAGATRQTKRRLAVRLSTEGRAENDPVAKSITRRTEVVGLPSWLARTAFIHGLNRRLIQAFPQASLARFLVIAGSIGFFGLIVALAFGAATWIAMAAGALGLYLPFFWLNGRRSKRQRQMAQQLPEALDFLSRVLRAGHSFSTGLQMMAEELPAPLNEEIRRCYDQHSLGQSLEEALKDTAVRIDSTDFAFFVTALLIQRQTGGDMSEVLKNISGMIRSRVRLAQQVKSKTAEGRFTGYILVAFPAVMFTLCYIQNPTYSGKLLTGTGLYFLGTAFGLQMLGLWSIKKLTTIKV